MRNTVIDEETEMTAYDLFEANHCYEDIQIA